MQRMQMKRVFVKVLLLLLSVESVSAANFVWDTSPPLGPPYILTPGDTLLVNPATPPMTNALLPTIILQGNNSITNNGTIQQTTAGITTIIASGGSPGPIAISNNFGGNIFTASAGAAAIDLSAVVSNGVTLNTFTGSTIGSVAANGLIVLPTNTDSIVNIAGGTIFSAISKTPGAGVGTVNVTGIFSTSNTMNQMDNINVNMGFVGSANAFTINNNITNFNTFTVNGGRAVLGNGATVSGLTLNNNDTFIMNSGTLTLTNLLSNAGTFTLAGGTITQPVTNNGTLNLNGGAITANITSANPASIINVGGIFTPQFAISAGGGTININSGGNLSVNQTIQNFSAFTINGGTVNIIAGGSGAQILGNIGGNNNGTLSISTPWVPFGSISNVATINLNAGVGPTFAVNNPITGFNNFNINAPGLNTTVNFGGSLVAASNGAINIGNGATLTLNSGTLSGAITGTGNSTLALQSNYSTTNSISNVQNINVAGGVNLTVNNPITGYAALNNAGTINLASGGNLSSITPVGPSSTVNINSNFTTSGTIGANTLNVNNGSTFTLNNPVTVTSGLNVGPNSTLALNNNVVNGTVNNSGNLPLTNTQSINGAYTQTSNGNFITTLGETASDPYGRLLVNGNANIGGTITVRLQPDEGFGIANNSTFDIIQTGGSNTISLNNPTLVQPTSAILSFKLSSPSPQILRLTAQRRLFSNVNTIVALQGVAGALDQILASGLNASQLSIFQTLDELPTVGQVESALQQLAPIVNGGIIFTALETQKLNFDKIMTRLSSLQASADILKTGYVAGDFIGKNAMSFRPTLGPIFFGNSITQQSVDNVDGYTSTTGGFGIIGDMPINCFLKVGAAVSYATSGVKNANSGDTIYINNVLGSIYAKLEYGTPFVDFMGSLGQNSYRTNRNITFLGLTAMGRYTGVQASGKVRVGVPIPIWTLEITPLAWYLYTRLNNRQYTETGAGAANLLYPGQHITAGEFAFGIRLADISEPELFYPEIHAMVLQFSKTPSLNVTSQFTGGGPAFITTGPTVPKTAGNIGGSIAAVLRQSLILIAAYDYEARKNYASHSVSLKLKYMF